MKHGIRLLTLLVVLGLAGSVASPQEPASVWEYKVVFDNNPNNDRRLNQLGSQGWELVAVRTTVFDGQTTGGHYYFKRKR